MFFPQLSTGAAVQFPVRRRRVVRTVRNRALSGEEIKYLDADATSIEWDLQLRGLTDGERAAIEGLFETCRGPLKTFTFLDPLANLLAYSEDLLQSAWSAAPMVTFAGNVADPLGTTRATRVTNTGQTAQRLTQVVAASASFEYCLSAFVRSAGGAASKLLLGCASGEQNAASGAGEEWRRVWLSPNLNGSEEAIYCGWELAQGESIELFGMQLEAQPNPSCYKRTAGAGGVYPRARFADDILAATAEGPDNHSLTLRITSAIEA